MQSMLVIGLGRFGSNLALELAEQGNEVMCVDRNEALINQIAPHVTAAQIGDCTDEMVLEALGVDQYDVCFVCISEDFQSSLEITSLLKEHGARKVVSKADRDIHAKFLRKIGADDVVYPERDMAQRTAMRFTMNSVLDYIELADDYALFEMEVPDDWAGRSALDLNVRARFNLNIIGVKKDDHVIPYTDAKQPFRYGDHLLVCGSTSDIKRMTRARR